MDTKLSILCVEDDPDIQTIIALALRLDATMAPMSASSGHDALAMMAAGAARPDVILLDLRLPDLDADVFLSELTRFEASAASDVILLTGDIGDAERRAAAGGPIRGVIPKPFEPLTLARRIREILDEEADDDRAGDDGSGGGT